jgi:hypothetical protein
VSPEISPGLSIAIHYWRGVGPSVEPDLFFWEWRFGFVTLTAQRRQPLLAYRKLRVAIVERVEKDEAQRARDADGQ